MNARPPPFPLIRTETTRLPRSPSHGTDRDSGSCLIALRHTKRRSTRLKKIVIVRNCYRATYAPIMVENMREYIPKNSTRYTARRGVPLEKLKALGFEVCAGPFIVDEPMHNCMAEMPHKEFAALWATHRVDVLGSIEARAFDQTAKFPETPTLAMIRLHWESRRVHEDWDADRIKRLCALWKLTPFELAELIQWAPGHMDRVLNSDALKKGFKMPGPVVVWFYFLENIRLGLSVFPDFTTQEEKAS